MRDLVDKVLNYAASCVQSFGPADFVDVAIIAVFIYLILVWIKRARVRFILTGMVFLGFVYVLARIFGLYLTTVVFQAFFAIFLIMIVVIFQDDFRHFFEQIAVWGITRRGTRTVLRDQNIAVLISGLANLSRKKIGALVVVMGKDPLDRYLEAGVHVDGLLSQRLVESIFEPNSPSHDGAVIIEGRRLTMFGCHLPLSTNIEKLGRFGTRHAAALGLAERTDALCIVVSEERGTISLAEDGRIEQLKDAEELRHALERYYRKKFPEKHRAFFYEFFKGNSLEKTISIALACSLWLAFGHRTDIVRRDFVVPVEYRNLAQDRIISETKSKEVTITLSGSERTFNLLDPKELKLSIDMTDVKEGESRYYLSKDLVRKPTGLSLVNIEPREVFLRVHKMISVSVPVQVKTSGRPQSGVSVKEIRAEPQSVLVRVPDMADRQGVSISTEPIDLKAITETTTFAAKLVMPPDIRFAGGKVPDVKVIVDIEKPAEVK